MLVAALEKSLGDDISAVPWMSDETKKAAEQKLTCSATRSAIRRSGATTPR